MKRTHIKTVLLSVFILTAAILLLFICLLWPVIRYAVSVKQLEDGLYSMEYRNISQPDQSPHIPAAELGIGLFYVGFGGIILIKGILR